MWSRKGEGEVCLRFVLTDKRKLEHRRKGNILKVEKYAGTMDILDETIHYRVDHNMYVGLREKCAAEVEKWNIFLFLPLIGLCFVLMILH